MANTRTGSNWISIGVAVLAVGLFLGWLATRTPPETTVVTEPDAGVGADTMPDAAPATLIEAETMQESARVRELVGQDIELRSVAVSSKLNPHLFWLELPNGAPYLVKLDSALVEAGQEAPSSGEVDVVGRVLQKDDAMLDRWTEQGVLQSEDERTLAEFSTTYLEARRIRPARD